jgi:hypothetical protein
VCSQAVLQRVCRSAFKRPQGITAYINSNVKLKGPSSITYDATVCYRIGLAVAHREQRIKPSKAKRETWKQSVPKFRELDSNLPFEPYSGSTPTEATRHYVPQ